MDLKSYYEEYNMYEDVFIHNLFLRLEKIERNIKHFHIAINIIIQKYYVANTSMQTDELVGNIPYQTATVVFRISYL